MISAVLMLGVAGCANTDRMRVSTIANDDYHARHAIVLTNDRTSVDVFPSAPGGRLDVHTAKQVATFGESYRQAGHGPILVLLPVGPGVSENRRVVADIRRALAIGGATPPIDVSTYPIANPALASPVRLSFVGMQAKVSDECGQWPSDVASGSSIDGWQNKQYYNFGCANQTMIAAQTADPRDLVGPRGEDPADTLIRSRAIENIRKATDPATNWTIHNSNIGTVGGS